MKTLMSALCAKNNSSLWPKIVPGYFILTFGRIFTPGPCTEAGFFTEVKKHVDAIDEDENEGSS